VLRVNSTIRASGGKMFASSEKYNNNIFLLLPLPVFPRKAWVGSNKRKSYYDVITIAK
jgi:hypothetical protein